MSSFAPSAVPRPASRAHEDSRVSLFEAVYVVLTLLYLMGAFGILLGNQASPDAAYEDRTSGSPLVQAVSMAFYSLSIALIILRVEKLSGLMSTIFPLLFLLGLVLFSSVWSVEPGASLRRSFALMLTMCFAVYVVTRFTPLAFLRLLGIAFSILIALSILAIPLGPGIERGPIHTGALKGILSNKNDFGRIMGLAGLTYFVLWTVYLNDMRKNFYTGMFVLSCIILWFSNARTPLLSLFVAIGCLWSAARIFSPRVPMAFSLRVFLLIFVVVVAGVLLPVLFEQILLLMGRDLTLTGRVKLWEYALDRGMPRMWFGAGFKTFWVDKLTFDLVEINKLWAGDKGEVPMTGNGHNGFLDMWLELGFFGLFVFGMLLLSFLFKSIKTFYQGTDAALLFSIGMLFFTIPFNLTNSMLLNHSEISWFCFALGYMQISKACASSQ